jgi:hypothetical protein
MINISKRNKSWLILTLEKIEILKMKELIRHPKDVEPSRYKNGQMLTFPLEIRDT